MGEEFKYSFKAEAQLGLSLTVYNVGFQKCTPGYSWGPGVRDHYLLHAIVSGRGMYRCGEQSFPVEAGQAFLAPPDQPISYEADRREPWEYYWVGFAGPAAPLLLAQTPLSRRAPVMRVPSADALRQALLDIYKARGADYASAVRMAGYLQAALGLLMDSRPRQGESALAGYAQRGAAFLQQNYSRPITVEDAARHAGVCRSYLYRAFQAEFGCAPSAYLTDYRIRRAQLLLRHSSLPIHAVAASVGFEDLFYFSRVFRRHTGQSPSAWRGSHRD